jgi:isopentenyl diphosphate isomerase/L-lactate dehydrogenase-like FMN-dependent dehydrogenase
MSDEILEYRFQNLHEFVKVARQNLDRNNWDYLIGGSESETTLARNRLALDMIGFRPRVLRDVSNVDCSRELFGKKLRIPVLCAPVGSLQNFEPGGGATLAAATAEFGNGMILSSVSEPGMEKTAKAAGEGFKIFQLYVRGDENWVDDHISRAIDNGYDAFAFTVDTDSYSRRERDIAKRHQRRRVRVDDARIYQAQFNWKDIERVRRKFDIPLILKGIATAEDAQIAVDHGVHCVYVSNHGGRQLDQGVGSIEVLPEVVEAVGGRARVMVDGSITRGTDVVKAPALCLRARRGGWPGRGAAVRDPRGRDPDLPVAARRHWLWRARPDLHSQGAPGGTGARPQPVPPSRSANREILIAGSRTEVSRCRGTRGRDGGAGYDVHSCTD